MVTAILKSMSHYRDKLADKGIAEIIVGRWRWYKKRFKMNNHYFGRFIELTGNKIKIDGVTLSVDNPGILTQDKSSVYFGYYEMGEREFTRRYIDRNLPTIEIGGSIGGVACITNQLLRDPTAHVVLECNPQILPTLAKNRDINDCKFSIEPFALSYDADEVTFTLLSDGWMTSGVHSRNYPWPKKGDITVPTTTLARIVEKYKFTCFNLISDCEGLEIDLVEREGELLRRYVKWLILEVHPMLRGEEATKEMLTSLQQLGFRIVEQDKYTTTVYAMENSSLTATTPPMRSHGNSHSSRQRTPSPKT